MKYGLYWQRGLWNMMISSSASRLLHNRSTTLYLCCKAWRIFIVKFVPKQDLPSKTYDHTFERAAREALFSFCWQWWAHWASPESTLQCWAVSCPPSIHALWTAPGKHFAHLGPNWLQQIWVVQKYPHLLHIAKSKHASSTSTFMLSYISHNQTAHLQQAHQTFHGTTLVTANLQRPHNMRSWRNSSRRFSLSQGHTWDIQL